MGHRVSANLFRIGLSRSWNSHWFAKSEYTYLLSLDYRVRDFINFIFYNLKWPTSELQIRRFLSRSVVLELLISIPDDQLVYYLDFTKFLGNISILDNVDPFKFNNLLFEYNYVLFNFAYNILGKSIFYLLLRQYKLNIFYDKSLVLNFYKNLFHLSNCFAKKTINSRHKKRIQNLIYLFRKKRIPFKSSLFTGLSKRVFKKLNFIGGNFRYFFINLLGLFSDNINGKIHIIKYNNYLLYLSDSIKVRRVRRLMLRLIRRLLSTFNQTSATNFNTNKVKYFSYFSQINKTALYLLYRYCRYNPYILLANYFQMRKFIGKINSIYEYKSYSKLSKTLLRYISYLNTYWSNKRYNIIVSLLFIYFISKLFKKISIKNSLLCNFNDSLRNSFITAKRYGFNKRGRVVSHLLKKTKLDNLKSKQQLSLILNNFPLLFWRKWKICIKKKKRRLSKSANKRIITFINRKKDMKFNLPGIALVMPNNRLNRINSRFKKRRFFNTFNTISKKHQFSKAFKFNPIKKLPCQGSYRNNYENRFSTVKAKFSRLRLITRYFNLKRSQKKFINNIGFDKFKRLVYPFVLQNIHRITGILYKGDYIHSHTYSSFISNFIKNYYYKRKYRNYFKKFKSYKNNKTHKLLLNNNIQLNNVVLLANNTSTLYSCVRICFFFDSLWYSYSGPSYLTKLLYLYKYFKYNTKTLFFNVYTNLYNKLVFNKFFNIFNCLRFENVILINIKFFRFFKKFFFDIKKKFLKKSILFFILFMYSYLNLRFTHVQLFIYNILQLFNKNDLNMEQNNVYKYSSVYIFIYYFYNHLKINIFVTRMLQLFITMNIDDIYTMNYNLFSYFKRINNSVNIKCRYSSRIRILFYNKIYTYLKNVYFIQLNTIISLQRQLSFPVNNCCFVDVAYSSFIKLIPNLVRSPYYILDRDTALYDIEGINDNFQLPNIMVRSQQIANTNKHSVIISKQWKQLISKQRPYFFRYIVDQLIYYLDNIRRDSVPVQSLQSFSNLIEYNLSIYLKNIVLFMPIYYLSTKVPFYQAKLICLFVSYELEKGIPYFLVLKQIILNNRIRRQHKTKRYFKNLNTILEQRISTVDDRSIQLNSFEFIAKYKKEWQSKSIFKYYILRNFYSLGTIRGFRHKLGLRISCSGRMYRRQTRSHTMWFVDGALPLRSFEKYIDFYSSYAVTHLGTIGVKVWVFLAQISTLC